MSALTARLEQNLAAVQARISAAARDSARDLTSIKLIAVTKYVPAAIVRALVQLGCTCLGESRPQELWAKAQEFADLPIEWHLVGHLQRNKIRRTLPLVRLIHSLDSERLLRALDEEKSLAQVTHGLLEVNVSGEAAKHGFAPQELEELVPRLYEYPHLRIEGLMCMAGLESSPDEAEREFERLRNLLDTLVPLCPAGTELRELSMGMSGDFEAAIRQGATMVRVGSALFEGIDV